MTTRLRIKPESTHRHWNHWMLDWCAAVSRAGVPQTRAQNRLEIRLGAMLAKASLVRPILPRVKDEAVLVALNWPSESRLFPDAYCRELIPWVTDCWGCDHAKWEALLRRQRFRQLFVSARDSVTWLTPRLPQTRIHWLPEAVEASRFDPSRPLAGRPVEVLELGRNHPDYHRQIVTACGTRHRHLFGEYFDPLRELPGALAKARCLVCFPRRMTHPEQAGGVETATIRYFEGMAAGCLLVGHAPQELVDLYGYNPVVEVDWGAPSEQLREILATPEAHQPLVDRNVKRTLEVGTFDSRVRTMLSILEEAGYRW
jgi:glycosyltransferase involved in cell wall biosynthesis